MRSRPAASATIVVPIPSRSGFNKRCAFDTIYHEHLCYFSVTALDRLFSRHGLYIADVAPQDIHGGTIRVHAVHAGQASRTLRAQRILESEKNDGVRTPARYLDFAERVQKLGKELNQTLRSLQSQGARIAAYGAAAKGTVLLNAFGIGSDVIDFVVDRSPHKQGMFMPGQDIPIFAPKHLVAEQPDDCLLLTWNFEEEIVAQQSEYLSRGGTFIVPIPEVRLVFGASASEDRSEAAFASEAGDAS